MPKQSLIDINLSTPELWLLLSQFGPAVVLGIEDPYLGWLADEVKDAHQKAAQSLLERGLAQPVDSGTIDVDDDLLALTEIIAHPQHTAILQVSSRAGDGAQRYFYLSDTRAVERIDVEDGKQQLNSIPADGALVKCLADLMRSGPPRVGRGMAFSLPEETLFKAAEFAAQGDENAIDEALTASGLTDSNAAALKLALTHPMANASLAVIINIGKPEVQHVSGFGILESEQDLWLLCPYEDHGKQFVEVRPTDDNGIQRRLEETLPGWHAVAEEV